jgi:hypothetical protein
MVRGPITLISNSGQRSSPLSDRINSLPKWARDYIMRLETRVDPQHEIEELIRDERKALIKTITELKRGLQGTPQNATD